MRNKKMKQQICGMQDLIMLATIIEDNDKKIML